MSLRQLALNCLATEEPDAKVAGVDALFRQHTLHPYRIEKTALNDLELAIPGRPQKPELVSPLDVKRRSMHTQEGRATAIHALAHIEFNAINLALDAIWRFPNMPLTYYEDWLLVAKEESYHFSLLNQYLIFLGYPYGSFPGHNSLWEMVESTSSDVLARMALVPRTMEARGLDAVPMMRDRFIQVKDSRMVAILDIILKDEIRHVEIGNYWFNYLCTHLKCDPITTYAKLARQYNAPILRGPFNLSARISAGFSQVELDILEQVAQAHHTPHKKKAMN